MTKTKKIVEIKSAVKEIKKHETESKLEEEVQEEELIRENKFIASEMKEIQIAPPIIREIPIEQENPQAPPQTAPDRRAATPIRERYQQATGRNPYDARIRQADDNTSPTTLASSSPQQNFRPVTARENPDFDRSTQRQQTVGQGGDEKKYYDGKPKRRYPWEA